MKLIRKVVVNKHVSNKSERLTYSLWDNYLFKHGMENGIMLMTFFVMLVTDRCH